MLKTTFKGEEGVIQELEEENLPEDHADAKRHSLLKADETKANFNSDARIVHEMSATSRTKGSQNYNSLHEEANMDMLKTVQTAGTRKDINKSESKQKILVKENEEKEDENEMA